MQHPEWLTEHPSGRRLVIGVGNSDRGDDAVGRNTANMLRRLKDSGRVPDDVEVTELDGEASALLSRLDGATAVFLIDACRSGALPGTVCRYDARAGELPSHCAGTSSHGLGIATAIELARVLRRLPARCIVYTIEGSSFTVGAPMSPSVVTAMSRLARRIAAELSGRRLKARP